MFIIIQVNIFYKDKKTSGDRFTQILCGYLVMILLIDIVTVKYQIILIKFIACYEPNSKCIDLKVKS